MFKYKGRKALPVSLRSFLRLSVQCIHRKNAYLSIEKLLIKNEYLCDCQSKKKSIALFIQYPLLCN